jgi:hypothetical protein
MVEDGGMLPSVYIESTIPSFIIGEMSPVIVSAARQITTRLWWNDHRQEYRLHISRLVRQEIARGRTNFARERLALLAGLPQLLITDAVLEFADELHAQPGLAEAPEQDVVHLAVASHYRMDYLLTWNLTHIANAQTWRAIQRFRARWGTYFPTICTPDELLGLETEIEHE